MENQPRMVPRETPGNYDIISSLIFKFEIKLNFIKHAILRDVFPPPKKYKKIVNRILVFRLLSSVLPLIKVGKFGDSFRRMDVRYETW